MTWKWGVILVCLLTGFSLFWLSTEDTDDPRQSEMEVVGLQPSQDPLEGLTFDKQSRFATRYAATDGSIEEDIFVVQEMLRHVALVVREIEKIPIAENRDFVRLLTGDNLARFAWIHPKHRSISEGGELLDRWGEPLFFHRESATRTFVRSAGKDREMWTDDDVFLDEESELRWRFENGETER